MSDTKKMHKYKYYIFFATRPLIMNIKYHVILHINTPSLVRFKRCTWLARYSTRLTPTAAHKNPPKTRQKKAHSCDPLPVTCREWPTGQVSLSASSLTHVHKSATKTKYQRKGQSPIRLENNVSRMEKHQLKCAYKCFQWKTFIQVAKVASQQTTNPSHKDRISAFISTTLKSLKASPFAHNQQH